MLIFRPLMHVNHFFSKNKTIINGLNGVKFPLLKRERVCFMQIL
ncbi:hypothetical protein RICGR_0072 [Rickettsiella grylli]|uniref:Uncharacterized protein n=1 Tax=Rickettsiella grylli TaxID=59196 RepID=A8PKU1_9COXI|nr:hypothetical protein RICGR_0072 [Rickettsiella grylli]